MRVFLCVNEVAGFYSGLKAALQTQGVDVFFADVGYNPHNYSGSDKPNPIFRLITWCMRHYRKTPKAHYLMRAIWIMIRTILMLLLFTWAIRRYDVFFFTHDSSFLLGYDLPILKLLGKKIIVTFLGSDIRPPYLNGALMWTQEGMGDIEYCIALTQRMKRRARRIDRYASVIISHPSYGHFHERSFINFSCVGIPRYSEEASPSSPPRTSETSPIRILHAPSLLASKGTSAIRQAISSLQQKGHAIDYIEITGQPNQVVIKALNECDFVIDQLYSDNYLAGFGSEAAACGKPVVVGTYAIDYMPHWVSTKFIPPVCACHPNDIEGAIEQMITDEAYRVALGQHARDFMSSCWSLQAVGERMIRIIENTAPAEWMYHPKDIDYVFGYGFPPGQVQKVIAQVVERGGTEALQLQDKPDLEQHVIEFVQ